jgi:hypothetical protein
LTRFEVGQPGDAPDGIAIDNEILPEGPVRPQLARRDHVLDLAAGERHSTMVPSG